MNSSVIEVVVPVVCTLQSESVEMLHPNGHALSPLAHSLIWALVHFAAHEPGFSHASFVPRTESSQPLSLLQAAAMHPWAQQSSPCEQFTSVGQLEHVSPGERLPSPQQEPDGTVSQTPRTQV